MRRMCREYGFITVAGYTRSLPCIWKIFIFVYKPSPESTTMFVERGGTGDLTHYHVDKFR